MNTAQKTKQGHEVITSEHTHTRTHTYNVHTHEVYTKYAQLNVLQHNRQKRVQSQSVDSNSVTSHLSSIKRQFASEIMKYESNNRGKNYSYALGYNNNKSSFFMKLTSSDQIQYTTLFAAHTKSGEDVYKEPFTIMAQKRT